MKVLTITSVLSPIVDAYGVGREIIQTTVNAMDAAEKERDSGADKKAWVLAFVKSFIVEVGQNWERWVKVVFTFIDFAKSIYNSRK